MKLSTVEQIANQLNLPLLGNNKLDIDLATRMLMSQGITSKMALIVGLRVLQSRLELY